MGIKREYTTRGILLFILCFLLFFGIGYKIFEWNTFNKLSKLSATVVPQELAFVQKSNENYDEAIEIFVEILSGDVEFEEALDLFDELDGKVNLALGNISEYISILERNKESYEKIEFATKLLIGKRRKLGRAIATNQVKYYEVEMEGARENIVSDNLIKNYFALMKDNVIMLDYEERSAVAPYVYYADYFSDIASLKKYTESNFEFTSEEEIKELYPYGFEVIDNGREYFGNYYSVIKDFVMEDYESAAYKFSQVEDAYFQNTIDYDRFFDEGDERDNERATRVIKYLVAKNKAIKEYKNSELGIYPLLPQVKIWKEDLELCQLYNYKTNYYFNILKSYPEADDVEGLIEELDKLPPSSSSVDDGFDSTILDFANTDEEIKFECTDKESDKTYTFTITK